MKALRLLVVPLAWLRFLHSAIPFTACVPALCSSSGIRTLLPVGRGLALAVTPLPLLKARRQRDLPSSWATLPRICPVLRPRSDLRVRPLRRFGAVPAFPTTETPAIPVIFRGSITRLLRSLSTLHGHGRPWSCKTRFRLLAKLCRVGLATNRVATKGFSRGILLSQALLGARGRTT